MAIQLCGARNMDCFTALAMTVSRFWNSRMSAINLSLMPNPDLVREFEEIAVQMSYAELRDDHKRYNKLFELQVLVVNELKTRGRRDALLPLLEHESRWIRLQAAKRTLAIAPNDSRRVLEELCAIKLQPEAGYAGMTLVALDKGWFVPE